MRVIRTTAPFLPLALILALLPVARGEVIEEIVARINDDIITRSELLDAERETIEEIYARETGEALDKALARAQRELLRDMITKRLLLQQAERLYDLTKMQDSFVRQFKEQQKIASNIELERLLEEEGLTVEEFRRKLVEINAPASVIDTEVRSRIAVSDAEIEKRYRERLGDLTTPERVTFRAIVLQETAEGEPATARAQALASKLRSGEVSFEEAAREVSEVEPQLRGGLLGPFSRGELAPELEASVFSMKKGEISDPIRAGGTVQIVRLEEREESVISSIESVRERISREVERQKFNSALDRYLQDLWRRADIHVGDEYMRRLDPDFRQYVK